MQGPRGRSLATVLGNGTCVERAPAGRGAVVGSSPGFAAPPGAVQSRARDLKAFEAKGQPLSSSWDQK